jgi:hypothetical protein
MNLNVLRSNPFANLMLRKLVGKAATTIVLRSAAICVASMIVGVIIGLGQREVGPLRLIFSVWFMIALTVAPFLAVVAAQYTQRMVALQQFELIHVTPLTNQQLVVGFAVGSILQRRNWILLTLGIAPVLILVGTYLMTYEPLVSCLMVFEDREYCGYALPDMTTIALGLFHSTLVFVNLCAMMVLATLLGLTLASWWRRAVYASYVAMFMVSIGIAFMVVLALPYSLSNAVRNNLLLLPFLIVLIGISYIAATVSIRRLD